MSYRQEIDEVARDTRYTLRKFVPIGVGIIIVMSLIGFALHSAGLIGQTAVERKVFETSYQRSESVKAEIAKEEANLAEIERQLANPGLDANTRYNLEAQATAARVRLDTARRKQ